MSAGKWRIDKTGGFATSIGHVVLCQGDRFVAIMSEADARACVEAHNAAGWQPIDEKAKHVGRVVLGWADHPTLSTHVELGRFKSEGWCNTYGHPFAGEPTHYWLPPTAPEFEP